MAKILSLDISSVKTGHCFFNNGRLIRSSMGAIDSKKGSYGARLSCFADQIKRLLSKYKPDEVVIEDIFRGRSVVAFKSLAMWRGVAIYTVYEYLKRDPISIMASTARGIVKTGKSKEDAFKFAVKKYKLKLDFEEDNDQTDAIILGLAAEIALRDGLDFKPKRKKRRKKK